MKKKGFTIVEILVVVAIIGILSTIVIVLLNSARIKARDTKRKFEISQIGKFLSLGCYLPEGGAGEYDANEIIDELKAKYPQASKIVSQQLKDPKAGTETQSYYRYIVTAGGNSCVLYANLENDDEPITLINLSQPTPGAGAGVLEASSDGWNGSNKYFQASN